MKKWTLALAFIALSVSVYLLVALTNAEPPPASRAGTSGGAPAAVAPLVTSRRERPGLAAALEDRTEEPAEAKGSEDRAASGSSPTAEEMRDHIEASFAADPPAAPSQDRAPGLETRMQAVIPAGSSVRRLECRSSLCRIETMHPSLVDFQDFVQRAYLSPDSTRVSNGPLFAGLLAQPVEGQPVVAVVFLGREGAVLPALAPAVPADGL
jgi:hypothetical protein